MLRMLFLVLPILAGTSLDAAEVALVKCYTGGDNPELTYSGDMLVLEQSIEQGRIVLKGRDIKIYSAQKNLPQCRDWHYEVTYYENAPPLYSKETRGWDSLLYRTRAATTFLACDLGSVLTFYDSTADYVSEVGHRRIEEKPPRPHESSGKGTVSSRACLFDEITAD